MRKKLKAGQDWRWSKSLVLEGNAVLWLSSPTGVEDGLWTARGQALGHGGGAATVPVPSPGSWASGGGWEAPLSGGAGLAQGPSSALERRIQLKCPSSTRVQCRRGACGRAAGVWAVVRHGSLARGAGGGRREHSSARKVCLLLGLRAYLKEPWKINKVKLITLTNVVPEQGLQRCSSALWWARVPWARHTKQLAVQMWYRQRPWGKELKCLIWRNKGMNRQRADWALVPDSYCQIANALVAEFTCSCINSGKVFAPGCWVLTRGINQRLLPTWSRGEKEGSSDRTRLLEMARTSVVMPTSHPVTRLLCVLGRECYFTAALAVPSYPLHELITSTVPRRAVLGVKAITTKVWMGTLPLHSP